MTAYDLSKEEFYKYNAEFRKTQIGFRAYMHVVWAFFFAVILIVTDIFLECFLNEASIEYMMVFVTMFMSFVCFILAFIVSMQYGNMLKDYINTQLAKKDKKTK